MANDITYLARAKAAPKYYALGLYRELSEKNVFLFAQAIAFKVLVTIVPVMVLATGVTGRMLRGGNAFEQVANFIGDFLPAYQSAQLLHFLNQLLDASGTITLIGAVGLLLSAMTLFTTLRLAIAEAFEQEWNTQRSILGGYIFDLRMVLQVGLLFILTVVLSVASQTLLGGDADLLRQLGIDYAWVRAGRRGIVQMISFLVPLLITTFMFFQLFYFIPQPHPPKRSAFIGALVTALLWELAKTSFTYYAQYVGRFDRYGPVEGGGLGENGMAALGTTFGLLIAFVFWVYYSGIVLILGAIIASLNERHRRIRQQDAEEAAAEEAAASISKLDAAAHEHPEPHSSSEPHAPSEPREQQRRQDAPAS